MKSKYFFLVIVALALSGLSTKARDLYPQIVNVSGRSTISLDGNWSYVVDPQYIGLEYNTFVAMPLNRTYFTDRDYYQSPSQTLEISFSHAAKLKVPGDWNTQDDKLLLYEGAVWYRRDFQYKKKSGTRAFLYFGAVNYKAKVAVNGVMVGEHEGGFTPFNFEVTDLLREGDNYVVVLVDNTRKREYVPTLNQDWWNYGGITRSVQIIETPESFVCGYSMHICKDVVKTKRGKDFRRIEGYLKVDGEPQSVTVSVPELGVNTVVMPDSTGYAEFSFLAAPELWSPENPKLYEVDIICSDAIIKDETGFRYVETQGNKILLNGKQIFCKGVCLHEETLKTCQRITRHEENVKLLSLAKEMGCNFVRLAHYPYNEDMLRTADRMGFMVWEEIPVYWAISWENDATYRCAETQLEEVMVRDMNRPSVIVWSVANETPESAARTKFLTRLIRHAKHLDQSRLVSAALLTKTLSGGFRAVNDALVTETDIAAFNVYMGWYNGAPEICDTLKWDLPKDKPLFISEFGCGAKYGYHAEDNIKFSDEFMFRCYYHNLNMFSKMDGLCGTTPWILKDFRSMRRLLDGIQDWYNRKGLVSEKGEKKSAFYLMKKWYESMDGCSPVEIKMDYSELSAVADTQRDFEDSLYFKDMYSKAAMKYSVQNGLPSNLLNWQEEFRKELKERLGLDRLERELASYKPKVELAVAREDKGEYFLQRGTIWTEPTMPLPFVMLSPKNIEGDAAPLVLALQGHSRNPELFAGIYDSEADRKAAEEGERNIGVQAALRGYIAIVPTTRAFGDTRLDEDWRQNRLSSCSTYENREILAGRHPIGDRVWDVMKIIDWSIANLPVMDDCVVVAGQSGGGTTALFTGAIDTRVAMTFCASYFCTFTGSIGSLSHCDCNYIPGILDLGEMYDVAGLTAPRYFRAIHGVKDDIFPIEHTRYAFSQLQRIYKAAGAEDGCSLYEGSGGHRFYKDGIWGEVEKYKTKK